MMMQYFWIWKTCDSLHVLVLSDWPSEVTWRVCSTLGKGGKVKMCCWGQGTIKVHGQSKGSVNAFDC